MSDRKISPIESGTSAQLDRRVEIMLKQWDPNTCRAFVLSCEDFLRHYNVKKPQSMKDDFDRLKPLRAKLKSEYDLTFGGMFSDLDDDEIVELYRIFQNKVPGESLNQAEQ